MNDETQTLMLQNIEKQVNKISDSFDEFKREIKSEISTINERTIRNDEQIKRLKEDLELNKKDISSVSVISNNIDKKVIRYIAYLSGIFAAITIGIQFALKFIK